MQQDGRRQEKGDVPHGGRDIIDGELAEQLSDLIEHIEGVRWVDVPNISPQTATAFNRRLIEARSQLLMPRVITDGGQQLSKSLSFTIGTVSPDSGEKLVYFAVADSDGLEIWDYQHPDRAREIGEDLIKAAEGCEA